MDKRQIVQTQEPSMPKSIKKPYRTPALAFYGDVGQVTRTGNGSTADGGSPGMSMTCWIAEALYGPDAPRTHLVRAWLKECYDRRDAWALIVVPLYRRFGERLAPVIRTHALLQRMFRPLFDCAVRKSHQENAARILSRNGAA